MNSPMIDFKNKNDYTVKYYFVGREPLTMQYVHSVFVSHNWVKLKFGNYLKADVIVRRSNRLLLTYNFTDTFIPNKPR